MKTSNTLLAPLGQTRAALADTICQALLFRGYRTVRYAQTAEEAANFAFDLIPAGSSVGIPGTVTVRQLGLAERLGDKNCTIYHHWKPMSPEERTKEIINANGADWFITSSNAMTYDGMMVNIDGTGNRVAGISWSSGKLLFIVSINKAESSLDGAIARARNLATPANALRIGAKTPCALTGHCTDCNSQERICRIVTILERVPTGREAHIILVGEDLGY